MVNEKRLIDANALKSFVCEFCNSINSGEPCEPADCRCMVLIDEQPTVDAVEVKHGRWIDEYPYVRCSECNAEWINCRTDNEPKMFYYCPNCGAKMDGDGNG